MRTRIRRALAGAGVAAVLVTTPACSGGDTEGRAAAITAPAGPVVRDLGSYDAFVLASAENNPLFADVYGIRFEPFAVERITTDRRVSSLGADEENVVVAAADQDVDRLAVVTGSGELQRVPGLGRPFAYNPTVVDGTMYYEDFAETPTGDVNRYYAWDLDERKKALLFKYTEGLAGIKPASRGQFAFGKASTGDSDVIVVRSKAGKLSRFTFDGDSSGLSVGRQWISSTLVGTDSRFGDKPEALLLLDPDTGTIKRVPGLQAICWTPDGTRLLARRTAALTDSQLVLVDPAKPDAAVALETVPGLVIYSGSWVRGAVPS